METIKEILMKRDGIEEYMADDLIEQAAKDLIERLEDGEIPLNICQEWFGLEPDYIHELI